MSSLNCPICNLLCISLKEFLKHVRLYHADSSGFKIGCPRNECFRTFSNYYTFRNHVYSHDWNTENRVSALESSVQQESINQPHESNAGDNSGIASECRDSDSSSDDNEDNSESLVTVDTESHYLHLQRSAALWILKVREIHQIPQSVIEQIIHDIQSLYEVALDHLQESVRHSLVKANVDEEMMSRILENFNPTSANGNLFPKLGTHHLQLKYCREQFGMVEPIRIMLGSSRRHKGCGAKRRVVEVEDSFMYIPLMDSLSLFLGSKNVLSEIHSGHSDSSGFLRDYCDGTIFKSHPLFSTDSHALQLIIYYDDVEVVNPLGSKRGIHKLGMFYYTLGNLSPKLRSQLKSIQLLAIVKTKLIKKYTMPTILKPLVNDIKRLENGVQLSINGRSEHFSGTIASICGDNLGSNALGGFKEGATAHRGCRHCKATPEDIRHKFSESQLELRSLAEHLNQWDEMQHDPRLSVEYGINQRSPLVDLQYFDMCNGSLVTDVMHDLLEGILQYEMKLLLKYYIIETNLFSASKLSSIMESYELGFMEMKNRPTNITRNILNSKDNLLSQNASQMWLLGRLLPAMIGFLIPKEDRHWECFLRLLFILSMLLSPVITPDETYYLEVVIEEHLKEFTLLYPNSSIIPKMHYLVHMPRLIRQFGPLICHWAMRFEAKHKWFKRLAQQLGNFKNLPYSLSMRYQQLQCYQLFCNDGMNDIEVGPGELVQTASFPCLQDSTNTPQQIYRAKWVKVNGTEYKKPCCLLLSFAGDKPVFGELLDIFNIEGKVHFHVKRHPTSHFSSHYQAYVLGPAVCDSITVRQEELLSHVPLHLRSIKGLTDDNEIGVILKYHISTL